MKKNGHATPEWREHTFTAARLRVMEFPPVSYVVPGFIPEGLTILAGRPKIGKSWLALDVCLGVAGDHAVLGGLHPTLGDVLYCALEDNPRRLQRRITKLLDGREWPARLTLATQWRRLDEGGVDDIADWATSALTPTMVVLDTLAGVKPERQARDTNYDGDYRALLEVHRLANERQLSVVALHHTRKQEAEDPLDSISGTLGLVGCADTALVLSRTPQGTSLYVRGRDVEEAEHAITFNRDTCRWAVLGEAAEVRRSGERNAILEALHNSPEPMKPAEIAAAVGRPANNVKQLLFKMVRDGEVMKTERGHYVDPTNFDNSITNRPLRASLS